MRKECETCYYKNMPQNQGDHCFKFKLPPVGIMPCSEHSKQQIIYDVTAKSPRIIHSFPKIPYTGLEKTTATEKLDGFTDYLTTELQDQNNMIAYIDTFLEDSDVDTPLLKAVLRDIKIALQKKERKGLPNEAISFRG